MSRGYNKLRSDHCAYFKIFENNDFILLLYIDEILAVNANKNRVKDLKAWLSREFEIKDLVPTNKNLGMQIHRDRNNRMIWLSQINYLKKIMQYFNMQGCKPISTILLINSKLSSITYPSNEVDMMEMS